MQTVHSIAELRAQITAWKRAGERVALVPTMGNLHRGHIHLVEQARTLAPRTVASIFVNPMQFGPSEDFAAYPRTLDDDSRQLAAAGLDLLVKASVLSESSLLALVEESLEQNVSFRAVFVDVSGFNIQVLETAIKMAALVQSGDCAIDIAFTILQESVRQPLALRRS